jgi:hypothetical protein
VLKVSWLYKDGVKAGEKRGLKKGLEKGLKKGLEKGLEQGLEKGLEKGLLEGRLAAKRESLRLAIDNRFPGIGPLPQIDHIDQLEVLDKLLIAVLQAGRAEDVRAAVQSAGA